MGTNRPAPPRILWGLFALLPLLLWAAEASYVVSGLVKDFSTPINGMKSGKQVFLSAEDLTNHMPVQFVVDSTSGFAALVGPGDCAPVYLDEPKDFMFSGGRSYVSGIVLGKCFESPAPKIRGKKLSFTSAGEFAWERPAGRQNRLAPGFVLADQDSHFMSLRTLRDSAGVVIAFIRSADWDPLSKDMIKQINANRDKLKRPAVAIHGYGIRESKHWADTLRLSIPLLIDPSSAVMRGYEVFDKGKLPKRSAFVIDSAGFIQWMKVYDDSTRFDFDEVMIGTRLPGRIE